MDTKAKAVVMLCPSPKRFADVDRYSVKPNRPVPTMKDALFELHERK